MADEQTRIPRTRTQRKKVLIIAYLFPPIGGGGVQRALKMAKYLGEFGWEPHVLTVEPEYHVSLDPSLLEQLPEGVHIHRCREWSLGRRAFSPAGAGAGAGAGGSASGAAAAPAVSGSKAPASSANGSTAADGSNTQVSAAARWKRKLFPLLKRIKQAVLIPDDQILWFPNAVRTGLAVMESHGIDAIWSTSGPVTDHLVGLYLKRKTGKPWIADFRDPWTQNMHRTSIRWREWLEDRLERMVHREADVLLTVTHAFARNFRQKFAEEVRRVEVIHNGFDRADYADLDGVLEPSDPDRPMTFLYTGIFYKERNPRLFLRAVRELIDEGRIPANRIRLQFAGVFDYPGYTDNIDCVRELGLGEIVEVMGHLPHRKALEAMKRADVLVLVGDTAPGSGDYIPGKLYEYMAVAKPILALSMPGESTRIIETFRLGVVADPNDLAAIKAAVMRMWEARMVRETGRGEQNVPAGSGEAVFAAGGGSVGAMSAAHSEGDAVDVQRRTPKEAADPERRNDESAVGWHQEDDVPSVSIYERREQARMLAHLLDQLTETYGTVSE